MKALTVLQPWAWALIHGPKRIENRSWATYYRGPLVIHAGKSKKWLDEGIPALWNEVSLSLMILNTAQLSEL